MWLSKASFSLYINSIYIPLLNKVHNVVFQEITAFFTKSFDIAIACSCGKLFLFVEALEDYFVVALNDSKGVAFIFPYGVLLQALGGAGNLCSPGKWKWKDWGSLCRAPGMSWSLLQHSKSESKWKHLPSSLLNDLILGSHCCPWRTVTWTGEESQTPPPSLSTTTLLLYFLGNLLFTTLFRTVLFKLTISSDNCY